MLFVREASPGNNLRDYLSIFFKHKKGIVLAFLVLGIIGCAGVVAYKTWIYQPKFEAKCSLLVKFGWENYSPELSLEKRQVPSVNQAEIVESEVSILQSRDIKERVISTLKPGNIFPELAKTPYQGLSSNEAALVLLEQHLVVSAAKKGNVIDVVFSGSDPVRAAAVVNQLVNNYIDKRGDIYKDPKSILFLERKADEFRQKLAESEDKLRAFREETKIVSFDEQRGILLKERSDLVVAANNAANSIREIQEKIGELERQLSTLPKTSVIANANDPAREGQVRLLNLQLQEKEMLLKYKEDTPMVANIRAQIEMVKEYLQKKTEDKAPSDPVYQDVQKQILNNRAEFSALKVRSADVEKQLGLLNADIQAFESLESRYKALAREVSANEEKYNGYRQRLEEARVYDEVNRQKMTSVSVIESAGVPIVPVNPRPTVLLIVAAVGAAVVCSLGIAWMREFTKQVMSTAMEAERRLDLPVLVAIPIKN
jgi:uncharacterized protein involved in exopolysaccharide biosynthesis